MAEIQTRYFIDWQVRTVLSKHLRADYLKLFSLRAGCVIFRCVAQCVLAQRRLWFARSPLSLLPLDPDSTETGNGHSIALLFLPSYLYSSLNEQKHPEKVQ